MNTRPRMFGWLVVAMVVTQRAAPHDSHLAGVTTHDSQARVETPEDEWESLPREGEGRALVSDSAAEVVTCDGEATMSGPAKVGRSANEAARSGSAKTLPSCDDGDATTSGLAKVGRSDNEATRSDQTNVFRSDGETVETQLPHDAFAMPNSAQQGANIERAFTEPPVGEVSRDATPEKSRFEGGIGLATGYQTGPDVRGIGPHLSARIDFTEHRSRFSAVFWGHFLLPPEELVESFFPRYAYEHQLSLRYSLWRFSFGLESEIRTLSHDGIRPRSFAAVQLGFGPSLGFRIIDAERCFLDLHIAWMPAAIRVAGLTSIPADLSDPARTSVTLDFAWRFLFAQAYFGTSRYGAVTSEFFIQPIAGVFAGARVAW